MSLVMNLLKSLLPFFEKSANIPAIKWVSQKKSMFIAINASFINGTAINSADRHPKKVKNVLFHFHFHIFFFGHFYGSQIRVAIFHLRNFMGGRAAMNLLRLMFYEIFFYEERDFLMLRNWISRNRQKRIENNWK